MSRSLVPVLHTCTSKMAAERSLLFAFYWRALISCEIKWIMPAKVKVRVLSARDLPVMHRSSDLRAVRHYDRSKLHRSWIDLSSHLSIYTQGGGRSDRWEGGGYRNNGIYLFTDKTFLLNGKFDSLISYDSLTSCKVLIIKQ